MIRPRPRLSPLVALAFALLLGATTARAEGGVPLILGHNGRLLDNDDKPINSSVSMTFELHETDNPAVVDPKWSETRNVSVKEGVYGVVLGDTRPGAGGTAIPAALVAKPELYLVVKIDNKELLPRLRIASTVYSLRSARAAEAEKALANAVDTGALQDKSVTMAKLADKVVTAAQLADKTITAGQLADKTITAGQLADATITPDKLAMLTKYTGLDADLLDGLDASAFAPASIVDTLGKPPSNSSISGEIASIRTTAEAGATAAALSTLSTNLGKTGTGSVASNLEAAATEVQNLKGALGTVSGSTVAARADAAAVDAAAIKARLGTPSAASLSADVAALSTQIAALKAILDVPTKLPGYSPSCQDAVAKGWKDEFECLHDGRWPYYFKLTQGNKQDFGGNATMAGFYAAAKAGADTKMRLGREWYELSVRSNDSATDFWIFLKDMSFHMSMVIHANGTIDNVHTHPTRDTYHVYVDNFRTTDLGNRHYAENYYSHMGAMSDLNQNGGVEFWARY